MSGESPSVSRPTVAIVGASRDHRKYGNKAVRAFRQAGWEVFPINLEATRIEELAVFRSLVDVPHPVDRVSIYLHPEDTLEILAVVASLGIGDVWLNPGSADRRVLARARELRLPVANGCSVVDIGMSPSDFP